MIYIRFSKAQACSFTDLPFLPCERAVYFVSSPSLERTVSALPHFGRLWSTKFIPWFEEKKKSFKSVYSDWGEIHLVNIELSLRTLSLSDTTTCSFIIVVRKNNLPHSNYWEGGFDPLPPSPLVATISWFFFFSNWTIKPYRTHTQFNTSRAYYFIALP